MKYQLWRLLGGADFRMINIKLVKTINSCVQVFKISSTLKTKSGSHGAWFQRKDLVKTDSAGVNCCGKFNVNFPDLIIKINEPDIVCQLSHLPSNKTKNL